MKQPIHLWDARHPKEREAFLYIPLLALGLTLISELFNHKAFTAVSYTHLKISLVSVQASQSQ